MTQNPGDDRTTVGAYLAARLVQLGADHLFGLPGDYNLSLLDEMLAAGEIRWTGSTNELNAAYAADGFARVGRRPAAMVTTYGVGELSALNGIAGSYAEDVPVVHVVGMPSRASMGRGAPLHHSFLDGDFRRFARMAAEVTAATAVLEPRTATEEIDRVLRTAVDLSKPVYLGVPLDVATAPVSAAPLATPLPQVDSEPEALEEFRGALEMRLAREHEVCVLAGPRVHRRRCEALVAGLAELPGVRVASQTGSKAVLDEEHPASLGTYMGATTHSGSARDAVDHATLLVMAGTVESDFTTGFFTHRYDSAAAVELAVDHARIGRAVYPGVRLEDALRVLGELVTACDFAPVTPVDLVPPAQPEPGHGEEPLDQARFWAAVGEWLAPCTLVVAEAGTSFYGALDLRLPRESDLLGSPVWSSIGFTLPATLGAGLARPEHRPVLFIGDGSAQLTIAELGTIYARGLRPVIFLLNNAGYTVERAIQSPDAVYQDIVAWDWTAIPAALGAPDVATFTVRTSDDLAAALDAARDPSVATFVEVVLPPYDAPRLLVELAKGVQATNTSTE